jgi:hypothetical protein
MQPFHYLNKTKKRKGNDTHALDVFNPPQLQNVNEQRSNVSATDSLPIPCYLELELF